MSSYRVFSYFNHCLALLAVTLMASSHSVLAAENNVETETAIDCSTVTVDYQDDPTLTRQEKLALMAKALDDSLNKFELCQLSQSSSANGGAAGGSGGAAAGSGSNNGGEGTESSAASNGQGPSIASDAMQGTETEATENTATGSASNAQQQDATSEQNTSSAAVGNGKIPEDIPSADNDDAIAAQIRKAAELETDPEIREKLWDEYRKYKGM